MTEGRKFPRIYFTAEDGVFAVLETEEKARVTARILNLSEGGFGLGLDPEAREKLWKDQMVRVLAVTGLDEMELVRPVQAKIMWIFSHEGFHHVGAGCMFIGIGELEREQFRRVVNARR